MRHDEEAVPSPCTNACQMHAALPWCTGCGRGLADIAAWPDASAAEKRAILARLPERMMAMGKARQGALF